VAEITVEGDTGVVARIGTAVAIEVRQEKRIEGSRSGGLIDLGQATGPAGITEEPTAPGQTRLIGR
jgi:hypothetical protein